MATNPGRAAVLTAPLENGGRWTGRKVAQWFTALMPHIMATLGHPVTG